MLFADHIFASTVQPLDLVPVCAVEPVQSHLTTQICCHIRFYRDVSILKYDMLITQVAEKGNGRCVALRLGLNKIGEVITWADRLHLSCMHVAQGDAFRRLATNFCSVFWSAVFPRPTPNRRATRFL
jgi:hypothetical protein